MSNRKRAEEVFYKVLAKPPDDRAEFLRSLCGTDATLRAEVEALLAADSDPRSVGGPPAADAAIESAETLASLKTLGEGAGDSVGPYKLLQQIGEGGFGAVFMAEQRAPVQRKVALKIIKPGMDTRQVIARFEQERQALAMMDHPNVARVLDAGSTESGRPYFVMELVRGDPITEYCDRNKLATQERLDLFIQVCHAVQHAHQKGIIHRDIKPNNILVTIIDGRPVPKIIDFGIAKATAGRLTERTLFTEFRQFIGTPQYMSPEQAEMSGVDVDTRSDIYSLGVLLYELLTGTTPFDPRTLRSAAYGELQRIIREVEPPRPSTRVNTLAHRKPHEMPSGSASDPPTESVAASTIEDIARQRHTDPLSLSRFLRGDLDWIVMKCLEKDRTRRYDTVNGLALDIKRHLDGEPVVAAPPSAAYKLRKFVRRHKVGVFTGSGIVAALLFGIIGTTLGMLRAVSAERHEFEERKRAEVAAVVAEEARVEAATQRDRALTAERLAAERANEAEAVTTFLSDMLASADPAESGTQKSLRDLLAEASAKLGKSFTDQPLVEARLRRTLGRTYCNLGLYDLADKQLPAALEIQTRLLGESHIEPIQTMHELATLQLRQAHFDEAEQLAQRALDLAVQSLGSEHHQTLLTRRLQAEIAFGRAQYARAFALREPLVEDCRRFLGPEHRDTLLAAGDLAESLQRLGRHADAVALLEHARDVQRRTLGEEHPDTLHTQFCLARIYIDSGRLNGLTELAERLLEVRRRVLGEVHPDTLKSLHTLAHVYGATGRPAEGVAAHEQVLAARRQVLGEEHTDTLQEMRCLAQAYRYARRFPDALALDEVAYERRRRLFGSEHSSTISSAVDLTRDYLALDRLDEAEALIRSAAEAAFRLFSTGDHPNIANALEVLVEVYDRRERPGDAVLVIERFLADLRTGNHNEQDRLLVTLILGRLYVKGGRSQDAVDLLEPALLGIRATTWLSEWAIEADAMESLLKAYTALGRADDARRMGTEFLDYFHRRTERADATANDWNLYALVMMSDELPQEMRDPAGALLAAQRANDLSGGTQGDFLDTLATACHQTGSTQRAVDVQRKALELTPPENRQRKDYEKRLAEYEAAMEEKLETDKLQRQNRSE